MSAGPKNVLVVGVPRSGTSMLAGLFVGKGYFAAEPGSGEFREADHANPAGYWEASSLIAHNVEAFHAVGFRHHNTWLYEAISPAQAAMLRDLEPLGIHASFVERYEAHRPWVWKDPRLCYTLPYWWRLVDHTTTRVVMIVRDPEAILRSWVRLGWREGTPEARVDVMARIEGHLQAARAAVRMLGIPCIEVHYQDFASAPETTAAKLSDFLDVDLAPSDLSFERRFDHSSPSGRLELALEHLALRVPKGLRQRAKAILPTRVLRRLFPGRGF